MKVIYRRAPFFYLSGSTVGSVAEQYIETVNRSGIFRLRIT